MTFIFLYFRIKKHSVVTLKSDPLRCSCVRWNYASVSAPKCELRAPASSADTNSCPFCFRTAAL